MEKKRAFTLIELILYVLIVSIILGAMVPFAINAVESSAKSATMQEVSNNARLISEKLKYEIRRASGVTSVTSNTLTLTNFSPDTSTIIDLSSGNIRVNYNGTGYVNLNSANTTVSSLVFTNNSSGDNKTKNIQFSFTVQAVSTTANRQEFKNTISVQSSAEIRSN